MQEIFALAQNIIETLAPWTVVVIIMFLFWKVPAWKSKIEVKIENIETNITKLDSKYKKLFNTLSIQLDSRW